MRGSERDQNSATIDHKMPLWMGGEPYGENVCAACWQCNQWKGPLDEQTFLVVRHDRSLRKRAVIAAQIAAESQAIAMRYVPLDRAERNRLFAESRKRLWQRVYDRIDELRGDLTIHEWFSSVAVEDRV